jgi:hypothetical protein
MAAPPKSVKVAPNFGEPQFEDEVQSPPPPGCGVCVAIGIFPAVVDPPFVTQWNGGPPRQFYTDPEFGEVYETPFVTALCEDIEAEVFAAVTDTPCSPGGPSPCTLWPEGVPPLAYYFVCADAGSVVLPSCPPGTVYDPLREQCVIQTKGPSCLAGEAWDFLRYACVVPIPFELPPPPPLCKPPGRIQLINGKPVCMADPPIPSPLPSATPFALSFKPLVLNGSRVSARETAINARERTAIQSARDKWSLSFLALDPTRRAGLPIVLKPCGCGGADENVEEVI